MRVALQDRTVHERTGVTLIGVADHILLVGIIAAGNLPLQTGGKAGTATSSQSGALDQADRLLRGIFGNHLAQRLVGIAGNRLVDVLRIDGTTVAKRDAQLFLVKTHVLGIQHMLFCLRIEIE